MKIKDFIPVEAIPEGVPDPNEFIKGAILGAFVGVGTDKLIEFLEDEFDLD